MEMERTESDTEVRMLVTENSQATDPKHKLGFVRFIDGLVGSGYFDDYDLEIIKRIRLWIEIFIIENLGDTKLELGEEWLLRVLRTSEAPETRLTKDGRRIAYVHVELLKKIEECTERLDRAKGVLRRTFKSGLRFRDEEIPMTCRENLEYWLPDGRIVKIDEFTFGELRLYDNPRFSDESERSRTLIKRYTGVLKTDAIRRMVRDKMAKLQPAPKDLIRAITDNKISI